MNPASVSTAQLFSAARVARVVELELWALRKLHPGIFPQETCWAEAPDGELRYTAEGLERLVEELRRRGYHTRSHSLKVWLARHREVPSAALVEPAPKNIRPHYAWQDRADLE